MGAYGIRGRADRLAPNSTPRYGARNKGNVFSINIRETDRVSGADLTETTGTNVQRVGARPGVARRRPLRALALGSLVVVLFAFSGLLLAAVRLALGPIDLDFIAADIRRDISTSAGEGFVVTSGPMELAWVDAGLRFSVRDLRVARADGTLVAAAPSGMVGVDPWGLLTFSVHPTELEVRDATLALTVDPTGTLALGGPPPGVERGPATPAHALLDPELLGRFAGHRPPAMGGGSLARLRLVDLTVTLRDERSGRERTFDRISVDFARDARHAFRASLDARGRRGPWQLWAEVDAPEADGRSLRLGVSGLRVEDLAGTEDPALVSVTLSAQASTRVGPSGDVGDVTATLDVGAMAATDMDGWTASLRPTRLGVVYRPSERRITIAPASVNFSEVSGTLSGTLLLPARGDPTGLVRIEADVADIVLGADGFRAPEVARATLRGGFEPGQRVFWIDRAEATGGDGARAASASGSVRFVGATPELLLDATFGTIDLPSVLRLWPRMVAPEALEWVTENVSAGRLDSATLALKVPPGHLDGRPLLGDAFEAEWRLSSAAIRLAPNLPPVEGVSGVVKSTGTTVDVEARDGVMPLQGGRLAFSSITFRSREMQENDATGAIEARVAGPALALLALGESNGVQLGRDSGLELRGIQGEGSATFRLTVPLYPDDPAPEPRPSIEAEFRNLSGKGLVEGRDLERGSLRVRLDQGLLNADGTAIVGGQPFRFSVRQDAPNRRPVARAETDTDDASRARLGIPLAGILTGPATLRLSREGQGADQIRRVEADLTQSRISIPQVHFEKPRGAPATISLALRGSATRITSIEDIVFQGRGFSVRGRARLGDDGTPSLVELTDVRLRPGDQIAARVEREGARFAVRLTGRSLDVRPFLRGVLSQDEVPTEQTRLELSIRVDRVLGENDVALSDFRLEMARTGPRMTDFTLAAGLGDGARVSGEILQDQRRPYLFLTATDGGALLRFVDLYRTMRGGRLTVTQTLTDPTGRTSSGVIYAENFRIVNDAGLQRLFGAAPEQDGQSARRAPPNDVRFDRLRTLFERGPGETRVRDGVLRNATAGITFEGRVDWRRQAVDLRGNFIPAYVLNNALARIPVLGAFLGGQEGGGLIGVTYAVAGPLARPTLRINPASAIAPGFLRNIFAFPDGDAATRPPESVGSTR